jgi:hypothetical protein
MEFSTDHLRADHHPLVRLMRLLGPSVLRIGGDSVDLSWWTSSSEPAPPWATNTVTPADLAVLQKLLAVTGWKVLLGVDLGHFEPARAADEARYARSILGSGLLGIEIGNEPNDFRDKKINLRPSTYTVGEYLREVEAYRQALRTAAPDVAIYGPAQTLTPPWLTQMGAAAHIFTELTQHYYATSTCPSAQSTPAMPSPTAAGLLSPMVRQQENEALQTLALAGQATGRPTRIGETSSVACLGSPAASPVFASALWALDWALRAASSGVSGLNFHGEIGVCTDHSRTPICAPSREAAQSGNVAAQPVYYGLLAARQLEGGRFVPTRLIASSLSNVATWATLAPNNTLRIAIDNFATEGPSQPVRIAVPGYSVSAEEAMTGPSVMARSDITLGGAAVSYGGLWRSRPARPSRRSRARVLVRPASAVIVTLRPKRASRR